MRKEKLYQARKIKGYSQQQMSDFLCMDVSNYQRRETGEKSISEEEWQKLAEVLDVPLSQIYESEDKLVFIFKDNAQHNNGINYNYSVPEYLLENQQKYITKLEQEIENLKSQLDKHRQ